MNINLRSKNAMVCGSTQGIGKATAIELASLGASVTLVARNEKKLKEVCALLPQTEAQKHQFLIADFQEPEALKEIVNQHLQAGNSYHILVNNTGGPAGGPAFLAETDAFKNAFSQHLLCNHILVQALIPSMKKYGYGRIINIISTSVKQPLSGLGVSNTIRGAVANWSKTLANELGPYGITVNNVLPGATSTERLNEIIKNKAAKSGMSTEAVAEAMQKEIPLQRFATPEEIAYAVAFLSGEAASYMNGINVPVDGGRTKSL